MIMTVVLKIVKPVLHIAKNGTYYFNKCLLNIILLYIVILLTNVQSVIRLKIEFIIVLPKLVNANKDIKKVTQEIVKNVLCT